MKDYGVFKEKAVTDWSEEEIKEIGSLMGDPNFEIYFRAAGSDKIIFIEDKRTATGQKLIEAGIPVTAHLDGTGKQRRHFDVLRSMDDNMDRNIFFLLDNDEGISEFKTVIGEGKLIRKTSLGFMKVGFGNHIFLLILPERSAIEDLFDEYNLFIEGKASILFDSTYSKATDQSVPANLTRAHGAIRGKTFCGIDDAKKFLRKQQDIKDQFWEEVESKNLKLNSQAAKELKHLLS